MLSVKSIRHENNQLSGNLNKENKEIYTDIVCYLRVSDLSDMQQEEVISDILRMFFDWEKQDQRVSEMIGDYKKFADDIIAALNPHKSIRQKSREYAAVIIAALCYMLTIDFIFLYLPEIIKGNMPLIYEYTLDMAVRGLIILVAAILLINYVGKNSFSLSKNKFTKCARFIIWWTFGMFIILIVLLSSALKKIILMSINVRYMIIIISVFWLYKIIQKIINKKVRSAIFNK